jgi:hypothetical protein
MFIGYLNCLTVEHFRAHSHRHDHDSLRLRQQQNIGKDKSLTSLNISDSQQGGMTEKKLASQLTVSEVDLGKSSRNPLYRRAAMALAHHQRTKSTLQDEVTSSLATSVNTETRALVVNAAQVVSYISYCILEVSLIDIFTLRSVIHDAKKNEKKMIVCGLNWEFLA